MTLNNSNSIVKINYQAWQTIAFSVTNSENVRLEGKAEKLKHLVSSLGVPAREIIGLYPERSIKKENVERILREIQLKYGLRKKLEHYNLLSWK